MPLIERLTVFLILVRAAWFRAASGAPVEIGDVAFTAEGLRRYGKPFLAAVEPLRRRDRRL